MKPLNGGPCLVRAWIEVKQMISTYLLYILPVSISLVADVPLWSRFISIQLESYLDQTSNQQCLNTTYTLVNRNCTCNTIKLPFCRVPYIAPTHHVCLQIPQLVEQHVLLVPIRFSQLRIYTFDFAPPLGQMSTACHFGIGGWGGDCCGGDGDWRRWQGLD